MIPTTMPKSQTDELATSPAKTHGFEPWLEEALEEITRLAAQVCDAPIALISLENGYQHCFKLKENLELPAIPAPHASSDIAFYAKIPLIDAQGSKIGTLSVIDFLPHNLAEPQRKALQALSHKAVILLWRHQYPTDLPGELAQFAHKSASDTIKHGVDMAAEAVFWITSDGRCVYASEAACRQIGYSREALLKLSIWDINPDLSATNWAQHWHTLKQTGSFTLKSCQLHKNGQNVPVKFTGYYLELEGKQYCCAIAQPLAESTETKASLPAVEGVVNLTCAELESQLIALKTQLNQANEQLQKEIEERKKVEKALQEREERVQALLNAPAESALLIDPQGIILATSEIAAQRLGVSPKEITGKCIYELQSAELAQQKKVQIEQVIRTSKPVRFEEDYAEICLENVIFPVFDDQGDVTRLAIFAWKISKPKQNIEIKDFTSILEYRPLLEQINEGLLIAGKDGTIEFVNQHFCEMLGYKAEELLGRSEDDLAMGEAGYCLLQEKRQQCSTGTYEDYEIELRTKSGETIWVLVSGTPVFDGYHCLSGSMKIHTDITKRKQAEAALQASEELHRITLSNITEAVFITDDAGKITFIGPNAQVLFGYSVAEIHALGKISKLLGENIFDWDQLKTTGEVQNIERQVRNKVGKRRTMLVNVKRVSIQEGTILYSCRDITDRRKAEEALYEERESFRLLLESVKDYAIFMLDPLGQVVSWNPGAEGITGYLASEIVGKHFSCFYTSEEIQEEKPWKVLKQAALAGRLEEEGWRVRQDGSQFWADVIITVSRDKFGYLRGFSVVTRDITERKRAQEQLWHAAFHDPLTGLPNRALFTKCLWNAVEVAKQRSDYRFAVLFLDWDRFKLINDSLGHSIGDQLLVAFAHRLQTCLRPGDTVARLGGDEFAILLDSIHDAGDADAVAEQIHASLKSPFHVNGHEVFTTVSIGIALSKSEVQEIAAGNASAFTLHSYSRPEDLLRDADTAMYRAKSLGRARHEVFNAAMHANALERLHLETDLRRAILGKDEAATIKNGEKILNSPVSSLNTSFLLHYQPIVSLKTGKLLGFEALLRWQHPTRGFISPTEFIPIAEDTGLIVPLGQWVLREACLQMAEWQKQFNTQELSVNVNLSSKQLTAPCLIEQIDAVLLESGLDATSLKLEITESLLMENAAAAAEALDQLKARNIQLCIDDFGTGYSSLSYLQSLPVSTLKIDRSFVSRLDTQDENSEIVKAIVVLANNLGMDVVAEGIETEQQLLQLKGLQCDSGQGYLFSKPLDTKKAEALITSEPQW
ncbi:bifunctional diguanylate cyclase/phosphodiesterase [Microcoleus sp. FACHB-68]|uniref:sensor domain-containing protein n=1 Tax=Microcoleus sp. FACHB-68 TaxID=2692826 RepID=UPI001681E3FB|nr:bifunctional diguanylate cyclase/phosphodiesterase [Microcoleus sp. FACHB-68]MBD1939815.1 PAS domain S-box protein [Microcoleus sp. FACHB-68]